jgi:hypothetical protein
VNAGMIPSANAARCTCCVLLLFIGRTAQSVFAQNPPATKPGGTSAGVCRHDPCGGEQKSKCFPGNYDGKPGLLYINVPNGTEKTYRDPSLDSPVLRVEYPHGSRQVYRDVKETNGTIWYYVAPPGFTPGWIPGSEVSCSKTPPMPPGKPLNLSDTNLMNAHPITAMVVGGSG